MATAAQQWVGVSALEDPAVAPTIRLEPLEPRHAPGLLAAADPLLFLHTMQSPSVWSVSGFEEEMRRVTSLPDVVAFAMVLRSGPDSGKVVGRTTYMDIKPEHRGLEVGRTWIGRAWHGTRVNPEAKFLMLRHAFERLSPAAIRVQITTNGTNLHSQRAISKLGAVREGTLRDARIMPASPLPELARPEPVVRDWVIFSILASQWPIVKAGLQARLSRMPAGAGT